MRTTAHGMSAGIAKVGALWASVWFNYLGTRQKFWITACVAPPTAALVPYIICFSNALICQADLLLAEPGRRTCRIMQDPDKQTIP